MVKNTLFTLLVAGILALGAAPAQAQFKPTKPIELLVHTGPGGGGTCWRGLFRAPWTRKSWRPCA